MGQDVFSSERALSRGSGGQDDRLTGCGRPDLRGVLDPPRARPRTIGSLGRNFVPRYHSATMWTGRCGIRRLPHLFRQRYCISRRQGRAWLRYPDQCSRRRSRRLRSAHESGGASAVTHDRTKISRPCFARLFTSCAAANPLRCRNVPAAMSHCAICWRKSARDAVRFTMLTRKADAQMEFDLDQAVAQTRENPVFYVQYAHARCRSVLRGAAETPPTPASDLMPTALAGARI